MGARLLMGSRHARLRCSPSGLRPSIRQGSCGARIQRCWCSGLFQSTWPSLAILVSARVT